MKKNCWCHFLFCLAFLFILAGCGSKATMAPPEEKKIGVLDLKEAVQTHPQWSKVEEITAQIKVLQKQISAEQNQGVAIGTQLQNEQVSGRQMELAAKTREWERQKEQYTQVLADKMELKKAELEKEFQQEADKAQQEKKKELDAYQKQLNLLYGPAVVNLQLKLQFSSLSEEERKKKKEELDNLAKEQEEKLQAKQKDLSSELDGQIQQIRKQIASKLQAYQQVEEGKVKQQLEEQAKQFQEQDQAETKNWQQEVATEQKQRVDQAKKIQADQKKIQELLKQKAALEGSIYKDLKGLVEELAKKRGYKAVVVNYRTNISGEDITFDIISQLKGLN